MNASDLRRGEWFVRPGYGLVWKVDRAGGESVIASPVARPGDRHLVVDNRGALREVTCTHAPARATFPAATAVEWVDPRSPLLTLGDIAEAPGVESPKAASGEGASPRLDLTGATQLELGVA